MYTALELAIIAGCAIFVAAYVAWSIITKRGINL